jgi:hypothetical protein
MSDTTIKFKVLGRDVGYTICDLGKSERLTFDGVVLVDSWGGGLGPWDTHEWGVARIFSGAARAAAEHKALRDYAENLLAGLLVNIPEIYRGVESCN